METTKTKTLKIAIVDDHALFRSGLINLIASFGNSYELILQAQNGRDFLVQTDAGPKLDLVIMDINMPVMNGFELAKELKQKYPDILMLVITMADDEQTLIKMLRYGVRGYLSKDVEPGELKTALDTIAQKGFYYTDHITGKLLDALQEPRQEKKPEVLLNDRETEFLRLACSEYTYKEIADIMHLSIKTIDGYRNNLFEKLQVKSRVGMVLYALRNNLVVLQ